MITIPLHDMNREEYERQKAFAGEKKPSMQRRCIGHDYTLRQMYMITMVTEGRRPLFGMVAGRSDAPSGSTDAPRMVLSELGMRKSCLGTDSLKTGSTIYETTLVAC